MDFDSVMPSEVHYQSIKSLADCKRTTLTLNSESGNVFTAPGSVVRFTVPSFLGGFIDFNGASIIGRVAWTGAITASRPFALLANGYSLFDNVVTSIGGTKLENLQHPSLSLQMNHELFSSTAELFGQSSQLLLDTSAVNAGGVCGRLFNTGTGPGQLAASFALPLMGCLGDCQQYLPSIAEITLELTVADIIGRKIIDLIPATSSLPTGFSLTELALVVDIVKFSDPSYYAQITSAPISVRTSTTLYNSSPLATGTTGIVDINLLSRAISCKRLMYRFSSALDSTTGIYSSSNPNSRSACVYIGTDTFPNVPIKTSLPAVCKFFQARATGSVSSHAHPGSQTHSNFCVRNVPDAHHTVTVVPTSVTTRLSTSNWSLVVDLESLTSGKDDLWTGTSIQASSAAFLRLEIVDPLSCVMTVHSMTVADAVISLDPVSGTARLIY
ncbi:hypothetical protein B484DRAFT_428633 [Ochromonadaceae sp. CCMP2298]|nr:hypothetical protein B484DRAFT_428633 [Ochromonadaceae sp. CCMP2298]